MAKKKARKKPRLKINLKLKAELDLDKKTKEKIKKRIKRHIKRYPVIQKAIANVSVVYDKKAELKQVILIRKDLKLPAGKAAAQAAHASVEAVHKSDPFLVKKWRKQGGRKIVLKVNSVKDIYEYSRSAENNGLVTAIITDAGKTTIAPGTVTCCAIGPNEEKAIDKITSRLKMY